MINAIKENKQDYQLASPSDHRTNPAERAIQAVKAHFINIRACTDPSFPKNQWDLLLPHTEFTLNLLRPSKINKNVSVHTIMHGHYDFMKHPISIAGTRVLVHDRPMDRGSWDDRGTEGFFINKTTEHYTGITSATCQQQMPSEHPILWNSSPTALSHQYQINSTPSVLSYFNWRNFYKEMTPAIHKEAQHMHSHNYYSRSNHYLVSQLNHHNAQIPRVQSTHHRQILQPWTWKGVLKLTISMARKKLHPHSNRIPTGNDQ